MNAGKRLILAVIALLLISLFFGSVGTIEAGHRGVVLRFGAVSDEIKGEGLYFKRPWIDSVIEVDVRIQKEQVDVEGASKDLQSVKSVVAINLAVEPAQCAKLYQTVGLSYLNTIVAPAMQESIKAVTAQYTAEELITKREQVRAGVAELIATKLAPLGIRTESMNIVNFDFSPTFNQAIEAKVTAEQNALAAKNLLSQKQFEAQQAVAIAEGKAKAMELESAVLNANPRILELRAIEKWDGVLPRVSSSTMPFINVDALTK